MTTKQELLREFATAICNLAFDMIEDAAEDAQGDIDVMEFVDADDELTQLTSDSEEEQAELPSEIAAMVAAMLTTRLAKVDTWESLRKQYPRSPI